MYALPVQERFGSQKLQTEAQFDQGQEIAKLHETRLEP